MMTIQEAIDQLNAIPIGSLKSKEAIEMAIDALKQKILLEDDKK